MEVIAELDSYQRELLMRMYRSRLNEEVFPVSFDMTGVGIGLMQCGFIVATNGFYEFTDYGLKTWKAYTDNLNAVYAYHAKLSQERRKQRANKKNMAEKKQTELSDWEKKAMQTLSLTQWDALEKLYQAGADTVWVAAEINYVTRKTLVRYGFIEYDQHNDKYWLLDAGVQKLERVGTSRNDTAPIVEAVVSQSEAVPPPPTRRNRACEYRLYRGMR